MGFLSTNLEALREEALQGFGQCRRELTRDRLCSCAHHARGGWGRRLLDTQRYRRSR